jgi:hypothetical protein
MDRLNGFLGAIKAEPRAQWRRYYDLGSETGEVLGTRRSDVTCRATLRGDTSGPRLPRKHGLGSADLRLRRDGEMGSNFVPTSVDSASASPRENQPSGRTKGSELATADSPYHAWKISHSYAQRLRTTQKSWMA